MARIQPREQTITDALAAILDPESGVMMPAGSASLQHLLGLYGLPPRFEDPMYAPIYNQGPYRTIDPEYGPSDRLDFWSPREMNQPPPAGREQSFPEEASLQGGQGTDTLAGGTRTLGGTAKARGLSQVDPRLTQIIDAAAARSPYDVQIFSGIRSGAKGGSRHNTGNAIDIALIDPATGQVIPNYKSSTGFPIYAEFARVAREEQMRIAPDMADEFRWGGGFSDKDFDLMHFDFKPGGAMRYWTWEDGGKLTEAGAEAVPKFGPGWVYANGEKYRAPEGQYVSLWGRGTLTASNDGQLQADPIVAQIQTTLAANGLYDGPVDGVMSPQTMAAVEQYNAAISAAAQPSPPQTAYAEAIDRFDAEAPAQQAVAEMAAGTGADTLAGGVTPPTPRIRDQAVLNQAMADQLDEAIFGAGPHRGDARTRPETFEYRGGGAPDASEVPTPQSRLASGVTPPPPQVAAMPNPPMRPGGAPDAGMVPTPPSRASGLPTPPWNPRRDPLGFPIDVNRPRLSNPDGSFATEETTTFDAAEVGLPSEIVTVPTIINGQRVSEDDAKAAFAAGMNPAVQRGFSSFDEANAGAQARTDSIAAARATNGERSFPSFYGEQPTPPMPFSPMVAGREEFPGALPAASREGDLSAAMGAPPQPSARVPERTDLTPELMSRLFETQGVGPFPPRPETPGALPAAAAPPNPYDDWTREFDTPGALTRATMFDAPAPAAPPPAPETMADILDPPDEARTKDDAYWIDDAVRTEDGAIAVPSAWRRSPPTLMEILEAPRDTSPVAEANPAFRPPSDQAYEWFHGNARGYTNEGGAFRPTTSTVDRVVSMLDEDAAPSMSQQAVRDQFDVAFSPGKGGQIMDLPSIFAERNAPANARSAVQQMVSGPAAAMGALPFAPEEGERDWDRQAPTDLGLAEADILDNSVGDMVAQNAISAAGMGPGMSRDPLFGVKTPYGIPVDGAYPVPQAEIYQPPGPAGGVDIRSPAQQTLSETAPPPLATASSSAAPVVVQAPQLGGGRLGGGSGSLFGMAGPQWAPGATITQGSGPYMFGNELRDNNWWSGQTNAMGGTDALSWTDSDGRTVTAYTNTFGQPGYTMGYGPQV